MNDDDENDCANYDYANDDDDHVDDASYQVKILTSN